MNGIGFGAPLILAALVALPALWWLLRVTPPAPRRVVFPPLRLLLGLRDETQTSQAMPWWLLLLRLLTAGLVIVALAQPFIGRAAQDGHGPLVLLVDNGWTAAAQWDARRDAIADRLGRAERARRPVVLIATADTARNAPGARDAGLLDAAGAQRRAAGIAPQPWPGDRVAALAKLTSLRLPARPEIVWLNDGAAAPGDADVIARLRALGDLTVLLPEAAGAPLMLLPPAPAADGMTVTVRRAGIAGAREGNVTAMNANGGIVTSTPFRIAPGLDSATAHLRLPTEIRNGVARLAIEGSSAAGAVQLMDTGGARRLAGIVSAAEGGAQPLLSDVYYLERALSPYADIVRGGINDLIARKAQVIILADVRVSGADQARLETFLRGGGVLLRFAGERSTGETDALMPVPLRAGGRTLGGAMAWASPQHLAPLPEDSPFGGLNVPGDVTVSRQILAEPGIALNGQVWARLTDGTPLVTAAARGRGWIALFHVTAGPSWSSLPISGLYVQMLRRVLALSPGVSPQSLSAARLSPLRVMDGYGALQSPGPEAQAMRAAQLDNAPLSPRYPPGLYGTRDAAYARNTVRDGDALLPFTPGDAARRGYDESGIVPLMPPLLMAALILFLIDAVISLALRGHMARMRRGAAAALAILLIAHPFHARADDAFDINASGETRLAYVQTGNPETDSTSRAGLTGLAAALKARTSYAAGTPMAVDVERDDLAFFPLLYWPMDPAQKDLSPQAVTRVSEYMRNGGTIWFDTRDLTLGPVAGETSPGAVTLRRLLARLDVPPLQVIPNDHVLTKSFYLLRDFPGRWTGGKVWVEALQPAPQGGGAMPARGGDGVSPLVVGGNDWAAAWAVDGAGRPMFDAVPGGALQRETALRFGINVAIYTLTGNYKADQVHVPALLERLK